MKYKIDIYSIRNECGDGCCSWVDTYAVLYEPGEDPLTSIGREVRIGSYIADEDREDVALEYFDLQREDVEFI